jgi:transcriptional regulator with XRE-family HTH domain
MHPMESKKLKKEVLAKFGKNLKSIRKEKKLSYRKLAALCDVDHSMIKKYEDGVKDLRVITLVDLALGLGIHPRDLLNFDLDVKR